jgi:hypothetical protein
MRQTEFYEYIVGTAKAKFGDKVFYRRELMNAVEERMRDEGKWKVEFDKPSSSRGKKSKGLEKIDYAFIPLKKTGLLIKLNKGQWCVPESPQDVDGLFLEGKKLLVKHMRYERRTDLIQSKKASVRQPNGAIICEFCGFDFVKEYGPLGSDFCECHHIVPLASRKGKETLNSIEDLRAVCSNCHRMIHRHLSQYPDQYTLEMLRVALGKK